MTRQLKDLKIGDTARLVGYDPCSPAYRMKLLSMGLTKGVEFELTKIAPLGDPVEIKLRGYALSLRKDEASVLQLDICGGDDENCNCGKS